PDAQEEVKEDWIDFIIELASFEYDLGVIFDQKADEDYRLATNETDESKLKLAPICELFEFRFPVRSYYSAFKNDKEPSLPFEQASYCVVTRHDYKLAVYDLHKEQYAFLSYMKEGLDISSAKLAFKEHHVVDAVKFDGVWEEWKKRWVGVGLFCEEK
ncbi:hypothetical protein N9B82_02715, partial [Saprospiraceae bacterium]|nr:hypothetical protein [Saprospiraceae bacterium]